MLKESAGPGSKLLFSQDPFISDPGAVTLRAQSLLPELIYKPYEQGGVVSSTCGSQSYP